LKVQLGSLGISAVSLSEISEENAREAITEILLMEDPHVTYENPSTENVVYSVLYMEKDRTIEDCSRWLVDELKDTKAKSTRTIIPCQTIKQCGIIYATMKGMLCSSLSQIIHTTQEKLSSKCCILALPRATKKQSWTLFKMMIHHCEYWLQQLPLTWGWTVRVYTRLFTLAHPRTLKRTSKRQGVLEEMVKRTMHSSFTKDCFSIMDKDMKNYVKTKDCRWKTLLCNFDGTSSFPQPMHMCCDNCAAKCKCSALDCGDLTKFPGISDERKESTPVRTR